MTSVEDARTKAPAGKTHRHRSEVRDGMRIDWDVPIAMDDGLVLRADVFRPVKEGRYPVILSYGPYAKGLAFQDGYPSAWQRMAEKHPDVAAGSSNLYQSWEVVDPEKWVPHDYACVRVDSRGCGCSPGYHRSFLAARDQGLLRLHRMGRRAAVVERQGRAQRHLLLRHQPVARGDAAAAAPRRHVHLGGRRRLVPRHDPSRRHPLHVLGELVRHAGEDRAVRRGRARQASARAWRARVRAARRCPRRELAQNRSAFGDDIRAHPLDDDYHRARSPVWSKVKTPLLSAANWGGQPPASARQFRGLRARGRQGQVARSARHRALDAFLHRLRPRAAAAVLRLFPARQEQRLGQAAESASCRCAIPAKSSSSAPRTNGRSSAPSGPSSISTRQPARSRRKRAAAKAVQDIRGHGRRRHLPDRAAGKGHRDHRAVGAQAVRLVVHQRRRPVRWCCACSPATSRRWCSRAPSIRTPRSARAGCARRIASSTRSCRPPYRPYHSHDKEQPLKKGEVVELDIEIWPTSIVVPAGCRIGLTIRGKDYVYGGPSGGKLSNFKNELTGCGPFLHDDPRDRPADVFGGDHQPALRPRQTALPAAADHSLRRRGNSYGKLITYGVAPAPEPRDKFGAICKDDARPCAEE